MSFNDEFLTMNDELSDVHCYMDHSTDLFVGCYFPLRVIQEQATA